MSKVMDLEATLKHIEELYERGQAKEAWAELTRARRACPGDIALAELEAALCWDEGKLERALELVDGVLEVESRRFDTCHSRALLLQELDRWPEALETFTALESYREVREDPVERAGIHFQKACCLDRLQRASEADEEFRHAARLAPDDFGVPPRLSRPEFEALVERALDEIPSSFDRYLRQVVIVVEEYPKPAEGDPFLLGLYTGVPRTERDHDFKDHLDRIIVFQRNLEIEFPDAEELREEIRKTVIHEVAHHFGLEEGDMGEYA